MKVITSSLWQTNAILIETFGRCVLVDSPVLPHELAALPRPDALAVTHAHFDHVLARSVFPDLPVHAGPATMAALRDGAWREGLRESDEELYVERDALPDFADVADVPCDLFAVIQADGHAADGSAFWVDDVLLPGDYMIETEIPLIAQAGSREAYLETLDRLRPYVARSTTIVPGHGPVLDRRRALELLDLDRRYVEDLEGGPLRGPRTHRQHRIHADNLRKHGAERTAS
jgi:glyoxylase-like metal-dependent hydrolase (beta-lactamase superfamily II)